ncbi:MAG: hypothetical protein Q8M07_11370 [Prosthecobacter sp.]|nr:hypothetical protein [Prosthecobacter sp.]
MPFVICEQHGGNVAPHACSHIAEKVWRKEAPEKTTFVDLDGFMFCGWVCEKCRAIEGLNEFLAKKEITDIDVSDADLDTLLDRLNFQPVCPKCFEAFRQSYIERSDST